ncbi:MAG: esterase-like activity of phytase family protein, partial [Thermomicrobiales bacterium]
MNLRSKLVPISFLMMAAIAPVSAAVAQEASPVASPAAVNSVSGLTLLGEQDLSNLTMVDGTLVGGLSGIDYDAATGAYVIMSDDRSDNNPARFYSASIAYGAEGFETIDVTGANTLLQADGQPYPNADAGGDVPDPEAIRFDPVTGGYWWTSEGNRNLDIQPSV